MKLTSLSRFLVQFSIFLSALLSTQGMSADSRSTFQPVFEFYPEVSFVYGGLLKSPLAKNSIQGSNYSLNNSVQSEETANTSGATLGIRKFSVKVDWAVLHQYRLTAGLRLDALQVSDSTQEFDSRSGRVYQLKPTVKLLDTYALEMRLWDSLAFSVGVVDKLFASWNTFEDLLEFGLNVQSPRKYHSIGLSWNQLSSISNRAQSPKPTGWVVDVSAIQGDRDRAEGVDESKNTFDQSHQSDDPYQWLALSAGRFAESWKMNLSVAGGSTLKSGDGSADLEQGKLESITGQFVIAKENQGEWPLVVSMDYRILEEKWNETGSTVSNRTHQSLSGAIGTKPLGELRKIWQFGVHGGQSKVNNTDIYLGYQVDLGYSQDVRKHCRVKAIVSDETRELSTDGRTSSGFVSKGNTQKKLNRFMVELSLKM